MGAEIEIITGEARLRPGNSEVERLWAYIPKNYSVGNRVMVDVRDSIAAWLRLLNGSQNPTIFAVKFRYL
jgi:hypothetical protein